MTAREAATLLGIHYNTVRNRIKAGTIQAEKVITEHGETWMIDPDTLTNNAPTSTDQQLVGRVPGEALTILARELVREAGLQRDPEAEARLEASKLEAEAAKTQVLISSGSFVGVAAVVGVLPTSSHLDYFLVAIFLLGLSLYASIAHMHAISRAVAARTEPRRFESVVAGGALATGVVVFGTYVFYNIPNTGGGGMIYFTKDFTKDQIVLFSAAGAVVTVAIYFGALALWRRRTR